MTKWLFLFALSLFLFGCSTSDYPGFKRIEDSVHFQLHAVGDDDRRVTENSFLSLDLQIYTESGQLIAKKRISQMEYAKVFIPTVLKGLMLTTTEGDSITVIGRSDQLEAKQWFSPIDIGADTQTLFLRIKVAEVLSAQEILQVRAEERLANDQELKQLLLWKNVLDSLGFDDGHLLDGIHFKIIKAGKGAGPASGSEVLAHYRTWLCDGMLVDDTYKAQPLEYVVGKPDQVLRGFATAISHMKQGDRALCVLPAALAYGDQGSTSGIVPPYAALVFEIELVKVGG